MQKKEKKEHFLQKNMVVALAAFVCCLLWGSAFPLIKIGYDLFRIQAEDVATQILFAGCRFAFAGLLVIILLSICKRKVMLPQQGSFGPIVILGLIQTVAQYVFFYIGLAHAQGVKASIIEGSNVFLAILIAALIFRQEALTSRKVLGCVLGFAGVVLVNMNGGLDFHMSFLGEGFVLISCIAYSFSSVFMKWYSKRFDPIRLSGYQFLMGGLIMIAMGLFSGGQLEYVTTKGMVLLTYLAFLSATAYSLWALLLKYNPISKVAVYGFMNPICGAVLSACLLHETTDVKKSVLALVLVCMGIYIVNRPEKR